MNTKTTLYFVRHAQSKPTSTIKDPDWSLSDIGHSQATKLAGMLSSLQIEKIISSPYKRCLDTITPFLKAHGHELEIHEHIRERKVVPGIVDNFLEIWQNSWSDFSFKVPGCESSAEAQLRFVGAIEGITKKHAGKTIAISTHGNVLGLFLNHLDSSHNIKTANSIRNPDVLKVIHDKCNGYSWDQTFSIPGLSEFTTLSHKTPIHK